MSYPPIARCANSFPWEAPAEMPSYDQLLHLQEIGEVCDCRITCRLHPDLDAFGDASTGPPLTKGKPRRPIGMVRGDRDPRKAA
jgi:hypothetical protein